MPTRIRMPLAAALAAASLLALAACVAPPASPSFELPPTEGVFDYQLGGAADRIDAGEGPAAIDVVVRDAAMPPLEGAYSVCYVNGFQTQPGEEAAWLARDELLLDDGSGGFAIDPAWPDEYVLDPSTEPQRAGILELVAPVIDGCAVAGFDAVEIDNLDTWTRFPAIEESGALALAEAYVDLAHDRGLAIAQKNAAEVAGLAHDRLGFDFAIAEECAAYDECGAYVDAYGERVLQVEYADALAGVGLTFDGACALADRAPLMILRDRDLVAPGHDGHRYARCD